jgi:hypothetical protein
MEIGDLLLEPPNSIWRRCRRSRRRCLSRGRLLRLGLGHVLLGESRASAKEEQKCCFRQ